MTVDDALAGNAVLVKMLAASISPTDLGQVRTPAVKRARGHCYYTCFRDVCPLAACSARNRVRHGVVACGAWDGQVKGFGASKPGVAGNEGVGVVVKVGPAVKGLAVSDLVVPVQSGVGTSRRRGR